MRSKIRKGLAILLAAMLTCSMSGEVNVKASRICVSDDPAAMPVELSVSEPPVLTGEASVATLSTAEKESDVSVMSGKTGEGKAASPEETKESGKTASPEETEEAGKTASPEETEESGETASPEETKESGETAPPEETKESGKTAPPTETETAIPSTGPAVVSTRPAVTGTPSTSMPPAVTETPSASLPPVVTEPPVATPPLQEQDLIPSNLSRITLCSLGRNKVRLRWEKSEPVLFYRVYRKKAGEENYHLLAQVEKTSYVDKTVRWKQAYRYRVVPVMQKDGTEWTGKGASVLFQNWAAVASDHQKYTYQEMKSDIKMLAKNYSGWVDYQVIGKSEDGREIFDVVLGNPNAKNSMIVVAAIHAREYMTSLLVMNQIEYYLQNYLKKIGGKTVKQTLNNICIHYIPMANPDGVTISQSGVKNIRSSALRRQIRRLSRGSTKYWKANARGVDLNRNFPYLFQRSGRRGSAGFTGPRGGSESETRAIVSLIEKLKRQTRLKGVVNYHAMGSIVFGDSRKGGSLRKVTNRMYRLARNMTGYQSAAGYQGSTSLGRGCLREYVMYKKKIPSITIEIGRRTCPGPIWEFPVIWGKNKNMVLYQARLLS